MRSTLLITPFLVGLAGCSDEALVVDNRNQTPATEAAAADAMASTPDGEENSDNLRQKRKERTGKAKASNEDDESSEGSISSTPSPTLTITPTPAPTSTPQPELEVETDGDVKLGCRATAIPTLTSTIELHLMTPAPISAVKLDGEAVELPKFEPALGGGALYRYTVPFVEPRDHVFELASHGLRFSCTASARREKPPEFAMEDSHPFFADEQFRLEVVLSNVGDREATEITLIEHPSVELLRDWRCVYNGTGDKCSFLVLVKPQSGRNSVDIKISYRDGDVPLQQVFPVKWRIPNAIEFADPRHQQLFQHADGTVLLFNTNADNIAKVYDVDPTCKTPPTAISTIEPAHADFKQVVLPTGIDARPDGRISLLTSRNVVAQLAPNGQRIPVDSGASHYHFDTPRDAPTFLSAGANSLYFAFHGLPDLTYKPIVLYKSNYLGQIDANFAGAGFLSIPGEWLISMTVDEGKLHTVTYRVTAGELVMRRINPDGTLDTTFGEQGVRRLEVPVDPRSGPRAVAINNETIAISTRSSEVGRQSYFVNTKGDVVATHHGFNNIGRIANGKFLVVNESYVHDAHITTVTMLNDSFQIVSNFGVDGTMHYRKEHGPVIRNTAFTQDAVLLNGSFKLLCIPR